MQKRVERVRNSLTKEKIDAILISNFYNILYLTGFKGLSSQEREAWAVITKTKVFLMTDARYFDQVTSNPASPRLRGAGNKRETKLISAEKNLITNLQEIITGEKIKTLGFEAEDLKVLEYTKFKSNLEVQLISTKNILSYIRSVKDEIEISRISRACQLADQCLKKIIKTISLGQTEKEIAWKIASLLRESDSELAFSPIVAVDENSALIHYDTKTNGQGRVKKGSIILIDFGARHQDYLSDMTRMVFFGKPKNVILKTYHTLLNTQAKTINELKRSTDPKHIDSFCRKLLTFNSELLTYPHSTGHGVGLEIHEYPKISAQSDDVLVKGNVITIEPGIYLPGKFGIRIEDTVYLAADKKPVVLTKTEKKALILNC